MDSDPKGTGGLFFGPPEVPSEDADDIGFAPDLDDDQVTGAPFDAPVAGARAPSGRAPLEEPAARGRAARYPVAEAALARLLGDGVGEVGDAADDDGRPASRDDEPFAVGPSITRPPPGIARPAATREAPDEEAPRARTDALMEDMVDMVLVGDDDGRHEVHLSFKEDVFGGLYLRLERRDDGLFAHFYVGDDRARRQVESYAEDMLARLRGRGMRISGWDVVVREP